MVNARPRETPRSSIKFHVVVSSTHRIRSFSYSIYTLRLNRMRFSQFNIVLLHDVVFTLLFK